MDGLFPDPLGIRSACRWVLEQTDRVRIDHEAVRRVAADVAPVANDPPAWDAERHWVGTPAETANWLLALDAANFSFWGEPRWRVEFRGRRSDGYWALVDAFVRAEHEGHPLHDARFLTSLTDAVAAEIFSGTAPIPLFAERVRHLREAGGVLLRRWDGQFLNVIESAGWSAPALAALVAREFSSFDDVAAFAGRPVPILKRAQILAADIHGAFERLGAGRLTRLEELTAFADYKVPQVLRAIGVLRYREDLAELVDRQVEIPPNAPEEVAIRAATVVAVDDLSSALLALGIDLPPYRLDWYLWERGQAESRIQCPEFKVQIGPLAPYHLTRTAAY